MSDLVDRARAALDGVTTGEWKFVPNGQKASVTDEDYDVLFRAVNNPNAYADARFIASARSLVPEMADRIEALEAALQEIADLPDVDADHRSVIARNALEGRVTNA